MTDQGPFLALAVREVQRDSVAVHGHHGVVDVDQRQRSLVVEIRHNEEGLELVAEVAGHEDTARRMDSLECVGADCYDVCNCLDGHTVHQLAEERMAPLAYHLVPLQPGRHFL